MTHTVKILGALLLICLVSLTLSGGALAEQGGAESITLTLNRAVMPVTLYHPGLLWTEPEIVTVHDFVIRNYFGDPITSFVVQQASARVEIPIENVREICQQGWISKDSKDIEGATYVVPVTVFLTDGREIDTIMKADFGTIEGFTEHGEFFLADPHTVTRLEFNR